MQLERQTQAAADSRVKALLNANRKKSVHLALFGTTHLALKKELAGRGLSIQATLEYISSQIADGHPHMMKMLDDLEKSKHDKEVARLEEKYTKNLYDVIGDDSVFGK